MKNLNGKIAMMQLSILTIAALCMNHHSFATPSRDLLTQQSIVKPLSSKTENLSVKLSLNSDKAVLQWKNAKELKTSHFVVQRSENGSTFDDAAVIFVPEDEVNTIKEFKYSDKIITEGKKNIYYRLKTVDANGKEKYSSVVIVSIDKPQSQII